MQKLKTEMCRYFEESGKCRFGQNCVFAHGKEEIRTPVRHSKYKTVRCASYHSTGFCRYGQRCQYKHDDPSSSTPTTEIPRERCDSSSLISDDSSLFSWMESTDSGFSTDDSSTEIPQSQDFWITSPFDVSKSLIDLPTFKNYLL